MGEYSMSYGIIRVAKFNSSAVRGIQIHDEREKDRSHSNPDIDFSKTEDNYSLQERANKTYNQVIKERIDSLNLKKAVRKDAVVMCSFVITSDKEFFNNISLEQEKAYFQKAYEFVKEKYGEQNIISAEVHKDETTPHLHINFIPVTKDNRLSAKSLFDKKSLKQLQDDFYSQVSREFGLDRGGIEEHQKNIDKVTYKREKVKKELEEISKLEQDILKKAHNIDKIYNNADYKELKREDFKAQIVKKGIIFDTVESNDQILERINSRIKPLFEKSKLADVIKKEYEKLKKSYENLKEQFKQVTEELSKYKEIFKDLKPEQEKELKRISERMQKENKEEKELIEKGKELLRKERERSRGYSR